MLVSIIIPLFNEEKRIKNLKKIVKFFEKKKFPFEIILVNDGSHDQTLEIIKKQRQKNIRVVSYLPNMGKGYAIKQGMLKSRGKYCLFTDIDLSTPISEFNKFFPHLNKYDSIIGSRKMRGSHLKKRQPILRESLGKVFTLLSKVFLQVNVLDFTCGFKCFSRKAVKAVFPKMTIKRWGFDPEVLFICKKNGFIIKEIPISWKDNVYSKVEFPKDIFRSFSDLIRIRINDLQKKYD